MLGLNEKDIGEMKQIYAFWNYIIALVENEHIKFNNNDYKNYMIVSLAQMQANQRLMKKLNKKLDSTIVQLVEISSKMANKS